MSTELLQALSDLGKEKGIEPEVIMEAVEACLLYTSDAADEL